MTNAANLAPFVVECRSSVVRQMLAFERRLLAAEEFKCNCSVQIITSKSVMRKQRKGQARAILIVILSIIALGVRNESDGGIDGRADG